MTADAAEQLRGRDAYGAEMSWSLSAEQPFDFGGSGLDTRLAMDGSGREVIVRRCRAVDPARRLGTERLLDNEIRAAVRLVRRYAPHDEAATYPPELAEPEGHNFDAAVPFLVMQRYRGSPATAQVMRRIIGRQQRAFAASLMTALAQLTAAHLVHGAIGLDALFVSGMDDPAGPTVQLVSFEQTVGVGERRRADGPVAHPGDDVLAAGRLLAVAFADVPPNFVGEPDLHDVDWLEQVLRGVFKPDPRDRPTAQDVLARLPTRNPPRPILADARELDAGRMRFDELRGLVRPEPQPVAPRDPTPPDPAPVVPGGSGRTPKSGGSAAQVALVVLGVLVVVIVVLLVIIGMGL